ncbi:Kinesin-like protein kif15 [Bulinus truncatus]|nr:Kinesin-like protein kif15 [Bulinus truncatus]
MQIDRPTDDSKSTSFEVKTLVRVRPPDRPMGKNSALGCLDVDTADNAIILKSKAEPKIYQYDNEAVFSMVGKNIIESWVAGSNATIFAYGQAGSGKTYTMLGPSENSFNFQHELRGVIPRSFEYLFSLIAHQQELTVGESFCLHMHSMALRNSFSVAAPFWRSIKSKSLTYLIQLHKGSK